MIFLGARRRNNRGVALASVMSAVFGGVVGNWMTSRKLKKKHDKEKKDLLQVNFFQIIVVISLIFVHSTCSCKKRFISNVKVNGNESIRSYTRHMLNLRKRLLSETMRSSRLLTLTTMT